MKISIRAISQPDSFEVIRKDCDSLVDYYCQTPILLSGFTSQFMDSNAKSDWKPLILTLLVDGEIVGVVSLKTAKKYGCFQIVKFLTSMHFSQDLVTESKYRDLFVSTTLDFLHKKLHCQMINLTLSKDSWAIPILEKKSKSLGLQFSIKQDMGHRVLPVEKSWAEFEKFRGSSYRRKMKKIAQRLDEKGSWTITSMRPKDEVELLDLEKKILAIEGLSWKEEWRSQVGYKVDRDLLMVLKGSLATSERIQDFIWSVYFLELENHPIAYALVFEYKKVAYIVKTTYDKNYKSIYPGIFIVNAAIRELFIQNSVKYIDFLTDLSFMDTWTPLVSPQVGVVISRKNILQLTIKVAFTNRSTKSVLKVILSPLLKRTRLFADVFS